MALNTFGWTPSEVTTDSAGNVISGVTLTVFTDVTKATQVTTLYDKDGVTPIASGVVVSDNKGRFGFKASDAYSMLYVYDGSTADPWPIAAHEALDAGTATHAQAVADAQAAADSAAQSASLVGAPADTIMATTVNNSASATRGALTATYAAVAGGRPGNKCVWLGDSLTQWQDAPASYAQRVSLANLGSVLSNQRIRYARNAGVGGNTTAQMLARFDTDVTPYAPNVVHLLGGTNDTASTVADTMSNLTAIVGKIRAIGAIPVMGTPPPKTAATTAERTRLAALAAAIKRYAEGKGIAVVDYRRALIDPATGGILAAYNNDNVHPNDAGFTLMGQTAADTISPLLPAWTPPLANENADPNNLIVNGLCVNISGTDYPQSWTGGSAITGLTRSVVTGDTAIKGNWYKAAFDGTTASAYQLYQNIGTAPVPGHRYAFLGKVKTSYTSGSNAFSIRNRLTGGSTVDINPLLNVNVTLPDGTFYAEYDCPAGITSQQVSVMVPAGVNGFIQWAQLTLLDLTAMGIA